MLLSFDSALLLVLHRRQDYMLREDCGQLGSWLSFALELRFAGSLNGSDQRFAPRSSDDAAWAPLE